MAQPTLFDNTRPRRPRRVLMHVIDAGPWDGCGEPGRLGSHLVRMQCPRCGHETDWIGVQSVTEGRRGKPCPECNATHQHQGA